jgi:hypothetical protein
MKLTRRALTALAVVVTFAAVACGSDSSTGVQPVTPVLGVQATPKGSTSILVSFNGNVGDNSYDIERAEGATGTFANVTNVAAPAAGGAVSYTDNSLKVNTAYRYRVFANRGSQRPLVLPLRRSTPTSSRAARCMSTPHTRSPASSTSVTARRSRFRRAPSSRVTSTRSVRR